MNKNAKHGLVWGGLLIVLGVMLLLELYTDLGSWIWIAVLTIAGMGVYGVFNMDREEKWILVGSYVLWIIAGLVLFINLNILRGEAIATYVLTAIAIPFLVVYLQSDRSKWGLLIPPYVLIAVGVMVGLIGLGILNGLLIPAYVMFAISIPFFVVYSQIPEHWWPLIPGGITGLLGLAFLIAGSAFLFIVPIVLIIAGIWVLYKQISQKDMENA